MCSFWPLRNCADRAVTDTAHKKRREVRLFLIRLAFIMGGGISNPQRIVRVSPGSLSFLFLRDPTSWIEAQSAPYIVLLLRTFVGIKTSGSRNTRNAPCGSPVTPLGPATPMNIGSSLISLSVQPPSRKRDMAHAQVPKQSWTTDRDLVFCNLARQPPEGCSASHTTSVIR